jgi:hypothetical protein
MTEGERTGTRGNRVGWGGVVIQRNQSQTIRKQLKQIRLEGGKLKIYSSFSKNPPFTSTD